MTRDTRVKALRDAMRPYIELKVRIRQQALPAWRQQPDGTLTPQDDGLNADQRATLAKIDGVIDSLVRLHFPEISR